MPSFGPHLGSRFFLTKVTKVSISAAVICFSSSLRLLWSRAVIVSSASTSYPICFCMKRNCLAMYSCKEKDRGCGSCIKNVLSAITMSVYLILPVILLGMTQHSVAKPANISKRSVSLVSKLLKTQHGTITTVGKRSLEKFENLKIEMNILIIILSNLSWTLNQVWD